MATPIFDQIHPKIIGIIFNFPDFATAKSLHQFILEIQSILESCDQAVHTHPWPCSPQNFLINF